MNKKTFFAALSAAVLVSASYIGYCQVSNSSENDLFMANVEALSSMEFDQDECPGFPVYAYVETKKGKKLGRVHLADSVDQENIYTYEYCIARGDGKLSGTNGYTYWDVSAPEYVPCTGEHLDVDF